MRVHSLYNKINNDEVKNDMIEKIKAFIRKIRSSFSVKTNKRPGLYIILNMVFINFMILVIAAFIATLIDPSFDNFFDAFARGSIKWMITPNSILYIDNPSTLVLAGIVVVIELVLFSGVIIALTTNAIKEYFQKKNTTGGKIYLEDHIVIINWNSKVPELVSDLIFAEEVDTPVVILSNIEKQYVEKMIRNAISKSHSNKEIDKKLNVIVKKGDPLLQTELLDVSIDHAKAIIVMSNDDANAKTIEEITKSDLYAIKLLLSVGNASVHKHTTTIVEVKEIKTKQIIIDMANSIESLNNLNVLPICFDRRLGQIIAQTVISSDMEKVYLSLFSFEGSEIYESTNIPIKEYLSWYHQSIPISVCSNRLFSIASNEKDTQSRRKTKLEIDRRIHVIAPKETEDLDVVIIGSNNKLQFVKESFKEYEKINHANFRARTIDSSEVDKVFTEINLSTKPYKILILSDDEAQMDSYDANVILTLLKVQSLIKRNDVQVIAEILDPRNDTIIKDFNIDNTIISNKIISLLLSKLALYPSTAPFYEELLSISMDENNVDRCSIMIRPCKELIKETLPIEFESKVELIQSLFYSFNEEFVVFGYVKQGIVTIFGGNLDQKESIVLSPEDQLIMLRVQK